MLQIRNLNLRTKLLGSFAVLVVTVVLLSVLSYRAGTAEQDALRGVDRSNDVVSGINDVLWNVSQMQTSFRGYMLSGDPAYLSSFRLAVEQYGTDLKDLKSDVLLDPLQLGRVISIEQDVRDWRTEVLEEGISLRQDANAGIEDESAPIEYLQSTSRLTRYSDITTQLQAASSAENAVRIQHEAQVRSAHRRELAIMIGTPVLAMVMGLGFAAYLARDIGGSISALGAQARLIASGDLQARVGFRRRDEIGRASLAFDEMADRLEQMSTSLRTTADEAVEREQRLKTVVDNVAEGLISFNELGKITGANPAAREMFAGGSTRLEERDIGELLLAPDTADTLSTEELMPAPGSVVGLHRTADGTRPDGTRFPVELVIKEIPDGELREFMGVFWDVSERRATEARLQHEVRIAEAAETQTRAVLDATSEAILVISDDRIVRSINKRFSEFFQVEPEEVVGYRTDELMNRVMESITDADHLTELVHQGRRNPDAQIVDMIKQFWPVERELEYTSIPVTTGKGERIGRLYALRDITHQREVDRMKNEFVQLVSHELRTPLTSIKGYVDLLLDEEMGTLQDEQREFLNIVGSNAQRLVGMVNELLDISRIESGKMELRSETMSLPEVLNAVVAGLRPLIDEKRQDLNVHVPPGLPAVHADPERVSQILLNLLSNAIKYTGDGGGITVTLRPEVDSMVIEVSDTGVGLTDEEMKQLFTRFYRARNRATRESAGAGLGLSITRSLVELHGGVISVSSTPGIGSTFAFTLPLAEDEYSPALPEPEGLVAGGLILLVEDDEDIANLIAHFLTRAGHDVVIARDAAAAVRLAGEHSFDLVTLDIVLPDGDGFSVLQALREIPTGEDVPVMMISMLPDDGSGAALGAIDYMVKPIRERDLVDRVSSILNGRDAQTVLIAEDDDDLRQLLVTETRRLGHQTLEAVDGRQAVDLAQKHSIDLALLDVRMPVMDGIETLHALRALPGSHAFPVIMMTGDDRLLSSGGTTSGLAATDILLSKSMSARDIAAMINQELSVHEVRKS